MKRKLVLDIDCGERTCASEPEKFCEYLQTRKYGSLYFCRLFCDVDGKGMPVSSDEVDGWIQRMPECMEKEVQNEKENS